MWGLHSEASSDGLEIHLCGYAPETPWERVRRLQRAEPSMSIPPPMPNKRRLKKNAGLATCIDYVNDLMSCLCFLKLFFPC